MSDAIIVALITGACAIVAQLIISRQSTKDLYAKLDKQSETADLKLQAKLENFQAVTNEKIDELAKRVEKHNNVIERTYRLEQESALLSEKMKVANNRISDLEKGKNP